MKSYKLEKHDYFDESIQRELTAEEITITAWEDLVRFKQVDMHDIECIYFSKRQIPALIALLQDIEKG